LGNLEERCGKNEIFTGAMQFLPIPVSKGELDDMVSWIPGSLSATEGAGLRSTIILEPNIEHSTYDKVEDWPLDSYFKALQEHGVTDQQLGRVVVAPEFIVGGWKGNQPENFMPSVEHITTSLLNTFPNARPTILIDTDSDELDAILPAIKQSEKSLADFGIKSVGVQAFANAAEIPFDDKGVADISHFLSADIVEKIAKSTNTKEVWLNTGITRQDKSLGVKYTLEQRIAIADAIADVIKELQQRGIKVDGLNIFAENKLKEDEKRDFSLHPGDEQVLIRLANRMRELDVPLSGFTVAPPKK
jgi:hypothetical protein